MGPDLAFALELADIADAITSARFRATDLRVETKPDLTPVSEADRDAEEAIRRRVTAARPGESVYGEEFGDDGGAVRWIVDPIDGTRNYVRGNPVWGTLIALERDSVLEASVISAPALGRRWWASRGEGAWADGERCAVTAVSHIEDAVVSTTRAHEMPESWRSLAAQAWNDRAFGDFWQHCLVAEGALDAAAEASLKLWDYAAVRLLVEEAGGRCTTFEGDPPAPDRSFVTTNGLLHESLLAVLAGS
jgi:histidinol-phosphatase